MGGLAAMPHGSIQDIVIHRKVRRSGINPMNWSRRNMAQSFLYKSLYSTARNERFARKRVLKCMSVPLPIDNQRNLTP